MPDWLHVHRALEWYQSYEEEISEEEWAEHVAVTPDLVRAGPATTRWTGHPEGATVELMWEEGRLSVGDPDQPTRVWLWELATELGGQLQGDLSEYYGPDGVAIEDEDANDWMTYDAGDDEGFTFDVPDEPTPLQAILDPNRQTSRADFFRNFLRRN
jgi:hypothetical protein